MLSFLIIMILVWLAGLLFGKADTKREVLNVIGFDLSPNMYETIKQREFNKYCKEVLELASLNYSASSEMDFLTHIHNTLDNINFNRNYSRFAQTVVQRRILQVCNKQTSKGGFEIDFSNKRNVKRYINFLWEKYQYPWPKDWIKRDSF